MTASYRCDVIAYLTEIFSADFSAPSDLNLIPNNNLTTAILNLRSSCCFGR